MASRSGHRALEDLLAGLVEHDDRPRIGALGRGELGMGVVYVVPGSVGEDSVHQVGLDLGCHRSERRLTSGVVAGRLLPEGQEIVVYKNNSDGKGNSYGCHENYLMARSVPFSRIVTHITPHFVTRQIYTGAGKVGTEAAGLSRNDVGFQLTSRADFFEEEVGLETTLKRPIVNTRDEPHAEAQRYRRLY